MCFFRLLILWDAVVLVPFHHQFYSILQEVAGDDTEALQSVLECDEEREGLLRRERELLGRSPVDLCIRIFPC